MACCEDAFIAHRWANYGTCHRYSHGTCRRSAMADANPWLAMVVHAKPTGCHQKAPFCMCLCTVRQHLMREGNGVYGVDWCAQQDMTRRRLGNSVVARSRDSHISWVLFYELDSLR